MSGMDERRKGMEEEYFHRKNQEAIEKLRAKMKVAEEAKAAGLSSMKCPRCEGNLVESNFEGVMIDTCDNCSGVWLDPGESKTVSLRLDDRAFAFWDVETHEWKVEPGEFELRVGTSSRDIRRRITITRG